MAELPQYRRAGVLTAGIGRVDLAGDREGMQFAGALGEKLDRMSKWAFGEAMDQAKEQGLQYGAENPVTMQQLRDAVTAGLPPDKLFQKKGTAFGDAARAMQIASVTTDVELDAQTRLNAIKQGVERGDVELVDAQKQIQSMLDGYGQTMAGVDPKASLKLRASLGTAANSAFLSMSNTYAKKQDELRKIGVDNWITTTVAEQVRSHIEAGDTVDPETGGKVTPLQRIDATLRRTMLASVANIGDPVYARQAIKDFERAVSEARVNALTVIAQDPKFAVDANGRFDPVGAVQRVDRGDFGPQSSVYQAMPADEQIKVRTAVRQAAADRHTAEQQARTESKRRDELEVNNLVVEYVSSKGNRQQAIMSRLQEISTASGAISGTAINQLAKAKREGDGDGSMNLEIAAEQMVRRGGITSVDELLRRVPNLKPKQVKRLADLMLDDGERRVRNEINLLAGIPEGLVQLSGDQQRRKLGLTRAVEGIKAEQIQKNGAWNPDTVIAELNRRKDDATQERAAQDARDALSRMSLKRKANITDSTGEDELKRLGYSLPEITEIQRQQNILRGAR